MATTAFGEALEEVGADLQCAGAADGLHGDHAASGQQWRLGAEQQLLHGLVVGGDAVDRQVAARGVLGGTLGSASITARSSGMRPSSLQYTPTPRLTLSVRGSALNASLRPRIGSRGASSTAENRLIVTLALIGE
jgi:hypothetical protein